MSYKSSRIVRIVSNNKMNGIVTSSAVGSAAGLSRQELLCLELQMEIICRAGPVQFSAEH